MGLTPNVLAGFEEFTCAMYGQCQIKDVNVLRYMLIKEKCGVHYGSLNLNKCQNLLIDMDGRNMKATLCLCDLKVVVYLKFCRPRCLSGLRRSLVHLLMIYRHCVLRNSNQINQIALYYALLFTTISAKL